MVCSIAQSYCCKHSEDTNCVLGEYRWPVYHMGHPGKLLTLLWWRTVTQMTMAEREPEQGLRLRLNEQAKEWLWVPLVPWLPLLLGLGSKEEKGKENAWKPCRIEAALSPWAVLNRPAGFKHFCVTLSCIWLISLSLFPPPPLHLLCRFFFRSI